MVHAFSPVYPSTTTCRRFPWDLSVAAESDNDNESEQGDLRQPPRQNQVVDYEYVPSVDKRTTTTTVSSSFDLESAYDRNIPAGMRAEAVRSALQSGQCVAWNFGNRAPQSQPSQLPYGALHLTGPGCLDFLNNQLSQQFGQGATSTNPTVAGFLTPKGRLIDPITVALSDNNEAYLLTSPGHDAPTLYQVLEKYIFPLDQVTLTCPTPQYTLTLASTEWHHVQTVLTQQVAPRLGLSNANVDVIVPPTDESCRILPLPVGSGDDGTLIIWPTVFLPSCAAVGYTLGFVGSDDAVALGHATWSYLTSDANAQGPVAMGALEYESLRIEAGQARYGCEILGTWEKVVNKDGSKDDEPKVTPPPTPLELFLDDKLVNLEKGCYRGQEGIASAVKNPRGPPRRLYQVVFQDEFNVYDYQTENDQQRRVLDNDTKVPVPGDALAVLGSNEEITVGTLSSVAEPGSTSDATSTVGLALIRRADSILKQMQTIGLSMETSSNADFTIASDGSGMILPPPQDPLDGLEVIVQGSFAVGTLRSIPARRTRAGANMFVEQVPDYLNDEDDNDIYGSSSNENTSGSIWNDQSTIDVTRVPIYNNLDLDTTSKSATPRYNAMMDRDDMEKDEPSVTSKTEESITGAPAIADNSSATAAQDDNDDEAALRELEKAEREAQEAAAEAQRKAEKMEMLRKRAEEAIARRKQKKDEP
eukprot:CAMPEP_0172447832 /NCGR_PEP_ID=MMETSP1065-20121228/7021_1 /TAXON_ID=265537 /ORGANISM="Amphiprora paludosa, Strain CCMP125" /LENGTH=701 /DNA_ID=CAMNT_0013199203 /DNA_START=101 /DNA_END=2206 /DNA_ORIENTATION=+